VKDNFSCVSIMKHHVMKTYEGVEGIAVPFLTSALGGGDFSVSRLCYITSGEKAPGTYWKES
jgi:hypothetical protein